MAKSTVQWATNAAQNVVSVVFQVSACLEIIPANAQLKVAGLEQLQNAFEKVVFQ